jgi:hypothetical protein
MPTLHCSTWPHKYYKNIAVSTDKAMECNPVMERRLKFQNEMEAASQTYLGNKKKVSKTTKQITITRFLQLKPNVLASLNLLQLPSLEN